MKSKKAIWMMFTIAAVAGLSAGCSKTVIEKPKETVRQEHAADSAGGMPVEHNSEVNTVITPDLQINQLEEGLSTVRCDENYGFDDFLKRGGASSDAEVIDFLTSQLQMGDAGLEFGTNGFGCSTIAVKSPEGEALFGRNFDWEKSDAMVVISNPNIPPNVGEGENYASISTVNMDFIQTEMSGSGLARLFPPNAGEGDFPLSDNIRTMLALYAPLDGMNENGFAVSVNMIQDSAIINQDTDKPDITTTTAIRLLLNKAADVDEALVLLRQYDMHSSMGMMVHFALADKSGRSVVVEYINSESPPHVRSAESNEMVVTETPAVTNFYLSPGEKEGIGSTQSHTRYEILMNQLTEQKTMGTEEVRDALDSVSKDNFGAAVSPPHTGSADNFESTEWSIVFNLDRGEARYYHREDYENSYTFYVNE